MVLGADLRCLRVKNGAYQRMFQIEKTKPLFFFVVCVLTVGFLSKKKIWLNSPKVKWCCLWTAASCVRESDLEVFDVSFLQAPALERISSMSVNGFDGFLG